MAATVQVLEWVTSTNKVDKTTPGTTNYIRFKKAGDATDDYNNPLVAPTGANIERSWPKYLRLAITAPPAGSLTNLQFSYTGSFGTGIEVWHSTTSTFTAPAAISADTGYTALAAGTNVSLGAGPYASNGDIGNFIRLYLRVTSSVTAPQTTPGVTFTFSYDEV